MNATQKRSLSAPFVGLALFTAGTLLGIAPAARSQDLVRGTITLPVTARLGNTTLPPGKYSYAVESLESIRSVDALQIGNSRVAVIVSSLNKDGQVVSLVANAFRADTLNSQSSDSIDFGTDMTITVNRVGFRGSLSSLLLLSFYFRPSRFLKSGNLSAGRC